MSSQRNLYPPYEASTEPSVGAVMPNLAFPADDTFPLQVGEPGWLFGNLHLEVPGVFGAALVADVLFRNTLQTKDFQDGIVSGDIQVVDSTQPDFFWSPTEAYPVRFPLVDNKLLTIHYRDYAQKHPSLKRPYRVSVMVEYVEKHPVIEALPDPALRARIYDDLLNSDYTCVPVDPAKYLADPNYSAVAELDARKLNVFGPPPPGPESIEVQTELAKRPL